MRIAITETVGGIQIKFEAEAETQQEALDLLEAARTLRLQEFSPVPNPEPGVGGSAPLCPRCHGSGRSGTPLTACDGCDGTGRQDLHHGYVVPAELRHMRELPACDDCPIGGRVDEHGQDRPVTCPRATLCDWEATVDSDYLNRNA